MVQLRTLLLAVMLALGCMPAWADSVDINTATADELAAGLVGVGPKKAAAIVAYREQHGPFRDVMDLIKVSGIGEATLEKNLENITIGGATAAGDEAGD